MSAEPTIDELREQFKAAMSTAAVEVLPEYLTKLRDSEDPEDYRKFLALAAEVNGWREPPPKNGSENLPVFHFSIGGQGAVSIQARVEHADGSSETAEVEYEGAPGTADHSPDVVDVTPTAPAVAPAPRQLPSPFANSAVPLTAKDVIDLEAILAAEDD